MNVITQRFGLLPLSNRYCIRLKILRALAAVSILSIVSAVCIEMSQAKDDAQQATNFNGDLMRLMDKADRDRMQAVHDRDAISLMRTKLARNEPALPKHRLPISPTMR